ncbi:MAG: TIGR02444 family protein [Pseudomonas sp.]|uniref:TIGR02444 family protein n=1 Tax=Pseudomonas sp. TaxID=306 RepID=UPI003D0DA334
MPTDLWRFAENLYQRPGVEAACLHLQAEGADVCLLLCAAWLEQRRVMVSQARADHLQQLAEPWQRTVVIPLRQIRQQWRTAAQQDDALAALRERIKRLELDAEREQLERLEVASNDWPAERTDDAFAWLEALAPRLTDEGRGALQTLRIAASVTNP